MKLDKSKIPQDMIEGQLNVLQGNIYRILCEQEEKSPNWEALLDNVLLELFGMAEDFMSINFLKLWYRLTAVKYANYKYARKLLLSACNLIKKIYPGIHDESGE